MAKEIKTLKVSSSQEAETIRAYQCFGWTLLNNQEVYVKDSHLERNFIDKKVYSVTETTHYVKLTFERDSSKLNNYQQLRQLENAYHAVPAPAKKPRLLTKGTIALVVCLAAFFLLIGFLANDMVIGIVPAAIIAVPAYLWQGMCRAKMPAWEAKYSEYKAKCEQILNEADQLC